MVDGLTSDCGAELALLQAALHAHLHEIVRERDPFWASAGHFYVQQYIQHQLGQWGTVQSYPFEVNGRTHYNLMLKLPGTRQHQGAKTPPILVGAHYDAVPGCPGADDNATGVAVLLELARAVAQQPARYPVWLVAFDLEEFGLQGSHALAQSFVQQAQPLRLMLSLEMLGYCDSQPHSQTYPAGLERFYPNRGDFIALIGNWKTIPDMWQLRRSLVRQGQVPCEWLPAGDRGHLVPATRRSDHAPFWDAGYRAMMVTDTADLRNPHYHQASDRLETLNLDFLTRICQGLTVGLQRL